MVLTLASVRTVAAQNKACGIDLGLSYVAPLTASATARVRITLGTGQIPGGTEAIVEAVRFSPRCSSRSLRVVPCSVDAPVVAYGGDETITSSCPGVGFSTHHAAASRPNQLIFEASSPVSIPANSPDFCDLEFDVIVLGPSQDATPDMIEQVASIGFGRDEAGCDNGLKAATAIGGGLGL